MEDVRQDMVGNNRFWLRESMCDDERMNERKKRVFVDGWIDGWMVGWLVVWLVGRLVGWSVG